jgi:class 3 adenylate cyclase
VSTIGDWLASIGLSEYAECFVENKIDISVLPDLTDQHLKDLGIALGDRLKMLRAIRDLGGVPAAAAPPPTPEATEPAPHDHAERRQVTVMFTDLVGSTALSARMDPEDLRTVIGAYHKCVAETVRRFDGFVAKYMGDGVLIYFSYPAAHGFEQDRLQPAPAGCSPFSKSNRFPPLPISRRALRGGRDLAGGIGKAGNLALSSNAQVELRHD